MIKKSITTIVLRGIVLVSRFVLMLFLARHFSPEDLGVYGIITTTIVISIYFLGLDFYVVNTREILARTRRAEQARLVRDQLVLHICIYVFVLPMLLGVFVVGIIPWKYIAWFYAILVLEHLSQEASRLLFTLSLPVEANIVLLFRSGVWVYIVIVVSVFYESAQEITLIWSSWVAGVSIGLSVAIYCIWKYLDFGDVRKYPVNWKWIKTGLKGAMIFLCSSIALRLLEYVDRYFIQHYLGDAMVGVYTLYMSAARIVESFIFTGLTSILYPRVVSAYKQGNMNEYSGLMKKLTIGTCTGAPILALIAAFGMNVILVIVEKPLYGQYLTAFWLLLVSVIITVIGVIPHYGLYVRHADKRILIANVLGLFVAVIGNMVLTSRLGIYGAAVSAIMAVSTMVVVKSILLKIMENRE